MFDMNGILEAKIICAKSISISCRVYLFGATLSSG